MNPILTGDLFAEIRRELVSLLEELEDHEWKLPTAAPKWNVKDIALHILGGDIGNLSRRRDRFSLTADLSSYDKLVAFINDINESWVAAGQRISPPLLIDLTKHVGRQADQYFASLDPHALGGPVDWAGNQPTPIWFDVAREYTERWHHQQQIRDATGRPGLYQRRLFEPILDTFVQGLPHTFRATDAKDGTIVRLVLTGALNKTWSLARSGNAWELSEGGDRDSVATVTVAAEDAWKIFTRGLKGQAAEARAEVLGDRRLGEKVLEMVSVIA